MTSFLRQAEEIFESAAHGREDCQLAILVGRDGGIHMLADSDWNLDRLREHHAAATAYRVVRRDGHVEIEARAAGQSCVLRQEAPARLLGPPVPPFHLLNQQPSWDNADVPEPQLHKINVRGIELAAWEWPGEGPLLFFVHGTGFHGRVWDTTIRALAGRRVLSFELRGHGRSSKPAPPYPWAEFGHDLAAAAESLGIEGAIGIGHSTGAHALVTATVDRPSTFASLLLIDPTIFPREFYGAYQGDSSFIERRRNLWLSPEEMMERFRSRVPFSLWHADVLRDYCTYGLLPEGDHFMLACPAEIEAAVYREAAVPAADLHGLVPSITQPVTVVRGGIPWAPGVFNLNASPTAPDLASCFPHGRDLLLEGRTHYIPMESPEWVAEQVAAISDRTARDGESVRP